MFYDVNKAQCLDLSEFWLKRLNYVCFISKMYIKNISFRF